MLDVENEKQRVRDVRADADDAEVLEDKVEDECEVDAAEVGQHAQERLQSQGLRVVSE